MNWEAIGAIGEVIGGAAVVATLIYLAIQLRQNTKGIRAQSYYNVLMGKNALYRELGSNKELCDILIGGMTADPPLPTVSDGVRAGVTLYAFMNEFETTYLLHKAGAVEEEIWLRDKTQMAGMIGFPGTSNWWSLFQQYFHKDFVTEVEATDPIIPIGYDPSTGKFVKVAPEDSKWWTDAGRDAVVE